jgi:hypothetical protein
MPKKATPRAPVDKDRHDDYIVTLLIDGQSRKNAREIKVVASAQTPEMAVKSLLYDPAIVQLRTQFRCDPISVTAAGRSQRIIGTCSKCGGCILEGARPHHGTNGILCEECGPDCIAPTPAGWLGDGLEGGAL